MVQCARRRNADFSKETAQIKGKINELELESDTTMRSVKALIKDKEDKMVAHDVLRLEVKKLKDLMAVRTMNSSNPRRGGGDARSCRFRRTGHARLPLACQHKSTSTARASG